MINLRRFVHTSCRLERGRTAFYNVHQKVGGKKNKTSHNLIYHFQVTDPAKQDPDYFEKKARELPLGEYIQVPRYISLLSDFQIKTTSMHLRSFTTKKLAVNAIWV